MGIYTIIFLAIGLAMDAFAVSVTSGAGVTRLRWSYALKIAVLFGVFQALMPICGWLIGHSFENMIAEYDHWIAFALLGVIGGRMIYHDFTGQEETIEEKPPKKLSTLLALSVATSIDALIVGIGFIVLGSIITPVAAIGIITFILCLAGVFLGHKYKHLVGTKVNAVGGAILILIGLKILIEHLSAVSS